MIVGLVCLGFGFWFLMGCGFGWCGSFRICVVELVCLVLFSLRL